MEKLAEVVRNTADLIKSGDVEQALPVGCGPLQKAAEEWAVASLRTFTGELLNKALGVSAAMSNFISEMAACGEAASRK